MEKLLDKYTGEERFWTKIDVKEKDDCWNWTAHLSGGYGQLKIEGEMVSAHRYAWSSVNGPVPDSMMILHKCDNKLCCNPEHLYCGTAKDNMRDKSRRCRMPSIPPEVLGAGMVKLHEGEIWLIRKLWKEGKQFLTQTKIAKMFKVTQSTISHIVNSTSWLCKEGRYV